MKAHKPLRAEKRNLVRRTHGIATWRIQNFWMQANGAANLGLRQAQCKAARNRVTWARLRAKDPLIALRKYWGGLKPRTRVISRILRELFDPAYVKVYKFS